MNGNVRMRTFTREKTSLMLFYMMFSKNERLVTIGFITIGFPLKISVSLIVE